MYLFEQNCLWDLEKDVLINIFLNLVQLRVTREASSRIYVILLMHFWRVLVFFNLYKRITAIVSDTGVFWSYFFVFKFWKFRKKIPEIFCLRNGRETLKQKKEQRVYVIASKL